MSGSDVERRGDASRPHARREPRRTARAEPARRLRAARRGGARPSPRGSTGARAARMPRSTPCPGREPPLAAPRPWSRSSPATTPDVPVPCAQALIAAGVRRVVDRPARHQPGRRRRRRHAASRRRRGGDRGARRRGTTAEPRLDLCRGASAALRHLEVRHHARRPERGRRRHQPLGLQPGRTARHPSAAGALRHHAGRHQHGRRRRPTPDRPRRGREPDRPPAVARGDGGARPRPRRAGSSTTRPRRCTCAPATPRPPLKDLFERDRQHVFLEGGPTLAAAFLGAGLVDEVVTYVAPMLLGAGRAAVGRPGNQHGPRSAPPAGDRRDRAGATERRGRHQRTHHHEPATSSASSSRP